MEKDTLLLQILSEQNLLRKLRPLLISSESNSLLYQEIL